MSNNIQILNYNHNVISLSNGNTIIITDNVKGNSISIPQPVTSILQINSPGPQGPAGVSGSSVNTGSLLTTASFNSYTSSVTSQFAGTASYATTASFALNGGGTIINTGSFVTTSSFNNFTSSYNTGSFTGSFTGSLRGTASFATTASYALNISSGGTVTSVAKLTLGTSGTDLSSTVANGTTTPVITLNVPDASASSRGVLSTSDWTNFNTAYTNRITSFTTTGTTGVATFINNILNIPSYSAVSEVTTPNIELNLSNFTIDKPGIFEITRSSDNYAIIFPNPNDSIGGRITIINVDTTYTVRVDNNNTYAPYGLGTATRITQLNTESYYQFISIGGKWRGGQLVLV